LEIDHQLSSILHFTGLETIEPSFWCGKSESIGPSLILVHPFGVEPKTF
jgi:hypothetical protein